MVVKIDCEIPKLNYLKPSHLENVVELTTVFSRRADGDLLSIYIATQDGKYYFIGGNIKKGEVSASELDKGHYDILVRASKEIKGDVRYYIGKRE